MLKLSIVTTSLNAAATIRDCLESARGQSYQNVEHIVIDAVSTDGTLDILKEHQNDLARVLSEPDNGIYDGMNKGLKLATGDVIGILNADDIYADAEVLEKVARVFEDEQVDSCYGDLVYFREVDQVTKLSVSSAQLSEKKCLEDENIKIVRYWKSGEYDPQKFYWGWMPPHPTFFVRREIYEKYGYFNLDLGTAADYELMLRFLLKHKISATYLPEILIKMRTGGASNETLASRFKANTMDRQAWKVNGLKPYPWTLWMKPLRKVGQWISRPAV